MRDSTLHTIYLWQKLIGMKKCSSIFSFSSSHYIQKWTFVYQSGCAVNLWPCDRRRCSVYRTSMPPHVWRNHQTGFKQQLNFIRTCSEYKLFVPCREQTAPVCRWQVLCSSLQERHHCWILCLLNWRCHFTSSGCTGQEVRTKKLLAACCVWRMHVKTNVNHSIPILQCFAAVY